MTFVFTLASFFLTSLLYFTGWMYLYYYLANFGFSIFEVNVPFHYIVIYSFAVLDGLIAQWNPFLMALFGFSFAFVALRIFVLKQLNEKPVEDATWMDDKTIRYSLALLPGLLLIVVFQQAQVAARNAAAYQADELRANPQPRILSLTADAAKNVKSYKGSLQDADLKSYLVQDTGSRDWKSLPVEVVFADQERYFLVLLGVDSEIETPIAIRRSDLIFLGSHYDRSGGGER